jgi:hypothetical protein
VNWFANVAKNVWLDFSFAAEAGIRDRQLFGSPIGILSLFIHWAIH